MVFFTFVLLVLVLVATPKSSTFIMTSAPCSFLANSCQVARFFLFVLVLQLLGASVWLVPVGMFADLLTVPSVELLVVGNCCLFIVWQTMLAVELLVWGLTGGFLELLLSGVVFFGGIHLHGGDGGVWGLLLSW